MKEKGGIKARYAHGSQWVYIDKARMYLLNARRKTPADRLNSARKTITCECGGVLEWSIRLVSKTDEVMLWMGVRVV